ncbi:ribonuclease H-like domain-containing protein [Cohnella fermenti]|uniref:YprB ribonuclease H-like domain-containing protein n=1 Tax=Cohnella fermenti TaxID=2565925 RepID=A0A4S4BIY3_9BACL|nr:ribonuclease H-like domain-containing protein [Cohnella fermenti]THF74588.1 hypothetical protein E6C55_24625 [Cohnella fermenti]
MSGGLRERLARLKAQASSAKPAEDNGDGSGQEGGGVPNSFSQRESAGATRSPADDHALHPAFERIGVRQVDNSHGSFLLRTIPYPLHYAHGLYELGALMRSATRLGPVALRQNKKEEADREPELDVGKLLFLDTETTGLGVGAGNVPFMIGIGFFDEEGEAFVVEQTLIRHPGEERAMLFHLLGRMDGRTHLVTYNGRTFDWPVLVNRYILNGWRSNGKEPGHLDFLHPSRALWRNTLESCRLSRIEEDRLGIARGEDVPGSLAPELYMRYLSDGDAGHLEGVYHHNERDILTLVSLAAHFGALLGGDEPAVSPPEGAEELYRTAAWLDVHGQSERSERLFEALIGREDAAAWRWWLPAAARYKRLGRYETALPLWERAAVRAERAALPSTEAHVELAMYYEHRAKDYGAALGYAEAALDLALRRPSSPREPKRVREERDELRKRVERLRRKLARG